MRLQAVHALILFLLLSAPNYVGSDVPVMGPAGQASIEELELPVTFTVRDGNRLYLEGRRIDEVALKRTPEGALVVNGDTLRLAPWAWILRHKPSRLETADERAVESKHARRRLTDVARKAYNAARQEGQSELDASEHAFDVMLAADVDSLVDRRESPGPFPGGITLYWRDPMLRSQYDIQLKPERVAPGFARTELQDQQYAAALKYYLTDCPDTCWVFVRQGGMGTAYCGGALVRELDIQLMRAFSTGEMGERPLPAEEVGAVLSAAETGSE